MMKGIANPQLKSDGLQIRWNEEQCSESIFQILFLFYEFIKAKEKL